MSQDKDKKPSIIDRKLITLGARQIANDIRAYATSQVDLWRQIPWLALEAIGRKHGMSGLWSAFENGVWMVKGQSTDEGREFAIYVDLLTGNLICPMAFSLKRELVNVADNLVLPFSQNIGALNASVVVHRFHAAIDAPYESAAEEAQNNALRECARAVYGIAKMYTGTKRRAISN